MTSEKRIGVLTSGGDCAGLNAVIRAVVLRAEALGWEVWGLANGTQGLMADPVQAERLVGGDFDGNLLRQAGTILGTTNKGDPFAFPMADGTLKDRSSEIVAGYHKLGLSALISIGGDGSQAILRRLATMGDWNLVAIPKTIDNDLSCTELSVGYPTAVWVATQALDNLLPTAASHSRVMVLEVMGRDAGHIALAAGIAGGADVILIPEIPYRLDAIAQKIRALEVGGRPFALVVVAEAVKEEGGGHVEQAPGRYGGIGQVIAQRIGEETGAETRVTVLGHLQRGGQPTPRDRLMASIFGVKAVDLVAEGRFDRLVAWDGKGVIDVPLEEVVSAHRPVSPEGDLVHTARGLGICLGDR